DDARSLRNRCGVGGGARGEPRQRLRQPLGTRRDAARLEHDGRADEGRVRRRRDLPHDRALPCDHGARVGDVDREHPPEQQARLAHARDLGPEHLLDAEVGQPVDETVAVQREHGPGRQQQAPEHEQAEAGEDEDADRAQRDDRQGGARAARLRDAEAEPRHGRAPGDQGERAEREHDDVRAGGVEVHGLVGHTGTLAARRTYRKPVTTLSSPAGPRTVRPRAGRRTATSAWGTPAATVTASPAGTTTGTPSTSSSTAPSRTTYTSSLSRWKWVTSSANGSSTRQCRTWSRSEGRPSSVGG